MKKAVFITGAQSGTGYGIAEHFAKNGVDVFITSRNGEAAERSAETLSRTYGVFSKGYECDIRNEQQVKDRRNHGFLPRLSQNSDRLWWSGNLTKNFFSYISRVSNSPPSSP